MSVPTSPHNRVTHEDVRELLGYLAANADVARADDRPDKVATFTRFQATVKTLVALVNGDLQSPQATPRST
ncbi:hypothetical protein OVA26_16030 [Microbacterium sp. SL62]|uniref:hypothetical protein n=1 Tax=Microbacterium sp. SL62 TaxID=2995139 RepID=UPI00227416C0|nr:hypothetical protein [Microbacterium sp. SL62]MCY1718444.1 hypothetical protein [Microbacterium sp. SL62]